MDRWNDKIAVVTGANDGIGFAIFKTLIENGLNVIGLDLRIDNIKKFSEEFRDKVHTITCDLTKQEDIRDAFKWIEINLGGLDLLVNNAGVCLPSKITDDEFDTWRQTFDLNVFGTTLCTKEALKSMRKRGDDGQIININSIKGHLVSSDSSFTAYTATKHSLTVLTKSLRNELMSLGSKIKVTSLSLGGVNTKLVLNIAKAMMQGINSNMTQENLQDCLSGQFLSTQDVANTIISVLKLSPEIHVDEITIHKTGTPLLY